MWQKIKNLIRSQPAAPKPAAAPGFRAFAGALGGRLSGDWHASVTQIDWDIYGSLRTLRARCRDLEQNNPVIVKYLALVTQNVIGANGFRLQVRGRLAGGGQDNKRNNAIESAFYGWCADADLTGQRNFAEIQRALVMGVARDGEALARLHETPTGLRLELLDPERLDINKNGTAPNGNAIRLGIEYDSANQPVNYYLLASCSSLSHPGWLQCKSIVSGTVPKL